MLAKLLLLFVISIWLWYFQSEGIVEKTIALRYVEFYYQMLYQSQCTFLSTAIEALASE